MMSPLRESGAHSSRRSRLGPVCMKPGLARTTQGGPSAILRSHPLLCGTFDMCLRLCLSQVLKSCLNGDVLEHEGIVTPSKSRPDVGIHRVYVRLVYGHTLSG